MAERINIFAGETDFTVGQATLDDYLNKPVNPKGDIIIFCEQGYAVFSLNFRSYLLKKGDLMILLFNTFPVFLRTSEDFSMSYCMLSSDFSYEVAYPISTDFLEYAFQNPIFHIPQEKAEALNLWWKLLFHFNDDESNKQRRTLVRNHVQNLLIDVDEHAKPYMQSFKSDANTRQQTLYADFCKLIWANYSKHHDVKFYADKLCITPYYLSRITNEIAGEPAKKIIDYYLIIEIKLLLETTDLSIKELAERFNFEDPSYMCRYFKRQMGVSPMDYRSK